MVLFYLTHRYDPYQVLPLRARVDLAAKGTPHPPSSSIAGTSPSDCLVSYPGHSLRGGVLPLCREAVGVFYSPSRLGKKTFLFIIFIWYNFMRIVI